MQLSPELQALIDETTRLKAENDAAGSWVSSAELRARLGITEEDVRNSLAERLAAMPIDDLIALWKAGRIKGLPWAEVRAKLATAIDEP